MLGFGMKEHIPDNEIVLEDHPASECGIPWKVVRSKQEEKHVWLRETERLLKVTEIFTMTSEELYAIYDQIQPLLKAEHEQWLEKNKDRPPVQFTKISIPKINKIWPKLIV